MLREVILDQVRETQVFATRVEVSKMICVILLFQLDEDQLQIEKSVADRNEFLLSKLFPLLLGESCVGVKTRHRVETRLLSCSNAASRFASSWRGSTLTAGSPHF